MFTNNTDFFFLEMDINLKCAKDYIYINLLNY